MLQDSKRWGRARRAAGVLCIALCAAACTQETQNRLRRGIQNRTGTNGVLDENLNGLADPEEKRVHFEVSDDSTNHVFVESPR